MASNPRGMALPVLALLACFHCAVPYMDCHACKLNKNVPSYTATAGSHTLARLLAPRGGIALQRLMALGGGIALEECVADLCADVAQAGGGVRQEQGRALVRRANIAQHVEIPAGWKKREQGVRHSPRTTSHQTA